MNDIILRNICKSFNGRLIFADLSLSIPSGHLTAVTGPSGTGKSTLLNCLGLLEKLDSGSICVGERRISSYRGEAQRKFRRDALGYMFQNYALIDNATIDDNLDVAMTTSLRSKLKATKFEAALERVGLAGRGKDLVYTLSGGEQQRVALARLLVKEPDVVLADEPTGALDDQNASIVVATLREIAQQGATVLIATHSESVVSACDSVINLGETTTHNRTMPTW